MPRPTDWQDTVFNQSAVAGAQNSISLDGVLTAADLRGTTLIRTIIRLNLQSATVAGAWGSQRADIGIGIVSRDAFTAGSFPDPVTGDDKPPRGWVWRDSVGVAQNGVGGPIIVRVDADIRGARKIENGRLVLVWNNTNILGTSAVLQLYGLIRVLMKLS